jgi:predicted permease
MVAVFQVVVPVFGIILCGFLCGRFRLLGETSTEALNRFVYYVALPALFVISMARVDIWDILNWPFLLALGGAQVATFVLALAVARFVFPGRLGVLSLHGLTAVFANTGYMGIPLLQTAFGDAGVLPAVVATVWHGAVIMGLGIVLLEADFSRGTGRLRMIGNVAKGVAASPLILAAVAGLAWSALNVPIPEAAGTFFDILAAAAAPCALFAMGLFMVGRSMTAGAAEVSWLVVLKLLVQPAITYVLAFEVLEMERLWATSAVVLAALPTGALVFVLAQQYGTYNQRSTAAILGSTVLSVVTLSVLFALIGPS